MLQPLLTHAIERTGRFSAVINDSDDSSATLELKTTIERFTLVYGTPEPHVEVALRAELIRLPEYTLVAVRRISASEPVETVRMHYVVAAFERAFGQCLKELTEKLIRRF